ncbi:MAG: efflux RND transporter periplasmic adaptor subunit [Hyphomicrobiaceae bacterium]|nr:MAG: efflux RND transporter periplasmic adaptor subunit [Hyphomicrobiaceae bacterium]
MANGRTVVLFAVAALALAAVTFAYVRQTTAPSEFQGWVEAELLFISPDEAGRVDTLSVREGDVVAAGAPLFTLDADLQRAAVAENEAAVVNARQSYDRAKALLNKAVGSQKTFDEAEAALRSAEARLNSVRTRLERRKMASPAAGTIQEIYFRVGEMVPAGRSIISLLPPGNVKVRFFVPQAVLPTVHIGDTVSVRCDGCAKDLVASIRFISAQAEFTPPVIYSQEERARLVFRVEAWPEHPEALRVGQPATVMLRPAAGVSHAQK